MTQQDPPTAPPAPAPYYGRAKKSLATLFTEFKAFALKGNVLDLAVAVIIGAAFTNVVNSMVKNLMMPVISMVIPGSQSYQNWHIKQIAVGAFLADLINFLILAFS